MHSKNRQSKTALSSDGTPLVYDIRGDGPVLLYITGATCFRNFRPIVSDAKTFAADFTVCTYDRRGRGDSGAGLPYSIDREIDDIEAIIDAVGGAAHLYGHSSGAVLALEAALRIPHKVERAVVYDAPYVHDETERTSYAALSDRVELLLRRGKNGRAVREFLCGIGMPPAFAYLLPAMPGWKTMKALAPTLLYDIALTADLPPLERLGKINLPVRVVAGEKSPAGLHQVAEQLAAAIPSSTCRILPGHNHMVGAEAMASILRGFLLDR
ncbi:alpha/beta fold hydrolase [Nocardia thraciensis]